MSQRNHCAPDIDFSAKNPPEHLPYVTVGLIADNILIFAVTSHAFLFIGEDVVQQYALSHATFSVMHMFTCMFLYGSIIHLAGNMLFLWIFGASLEGRVGPLKFIAIYLLACLTHRQRRRSARLPVSLLYFSSRVRIL